MADTYYARLGHLLADHRRRQLQMMAAFCKYWRIGPAEYKALTVEELEAMTRFANEDIERQRRASKKRGRR